MSMLAIKDETGWKPPTNLYGRSRPDTKDIFAFEMKKFHDKDLSQPERDAYMYDWLTTLIQFLRSLKDSMPPPPENVWEEVPQWGEKVQQDTLTLLNSFISIPTAPCTHPLIGECCSLAYRAGPGLQTMSTSIQKCSEVLRVRHNSDSEILWYSQKLCALHVLSRLYRDHGRTTGPHSSDTLQLLLRTLKQADNTTRCVLLECIESFVVGLGSALSSSYKDILKVCRSQLQDKNSKVRIKSVSCLSQLLPYVWHTLSPSEAEQLLSAVVKTFDGAEHSLRIELAHLSSVYLYHSLEDQSGEKGRSKKLTPDDLFSLIHVLYNKNPSLGCRGGVIMSLLELVRRTGTRWLESNLYKLVRCGVGLLSLSKHGSAELLLSRKLVVFFLKQLTAQLPNEHMQLELAKHLCTLVISHAKLKSPGKDKGSNSGLDTSLSSDQAISGCVLIVLGVIIKRISTLSAELIQETLEGPVEMSGAMLTGSAVSAVAVGLESRHSYCRCAAVWTLQCLALSVPTHNGLLIDWALSKLSSESSPSPDMCTYSLAVASLVRASTCSDLGLPLTKAKSVLSMSEDMLILESVTDLRAKLFRVRASWYLLGALISLGVSFVRPILSKLLNLWRSSFPHSPEELEKEKSGFDSQTLQLQVEHRVGALASLRIFLQQCPDLCSEDVTKKLKLPVESAIAFVSTLPKIIRSSDTNLTLNIPLLKLQLYQLLLSCPDSWLEDSMSSLLREVVAQFVQPDSLLPLQTTLAWELTQADDLVCLDILPYSSQDSELDSILRSNCVEQLGSVDSLPGALFQERLVDGDNTCFLHSLPVSRATINVSIRLFGKVFPHANDKHKLQLLTHFKDVLKQSKQNRLQVMLFNLVTALFLAFRSSSTLRKLIAGSDITQTGLSFLLAVVNTSNPLLACLSTGTIARFCQSVSPQSSKQIVTQLLKHIEQVLSDVTRDNSIKSGYCLLLSAIHKHVGLGSPQHLATSFKLLSDMTALPAPPLQLSALYSLSQMCDAGGPLFRPQIHPSLCLVHEALFTVSPLESELIRTAGQCLGSLLDALGPEIQGMVRAKERVLQCAGVLRAHHDPVVQGFAITCLQKALLFCPDNVSQSSLIPFLYSCLTPSYPSNPAFSWVTSAALSCMRQCVQKDATPVWEVSVQNEMQLLTTLIHLLDLYESDLVIVRDVREILDCLQSALYSTCLSTWISLYQRILGSEQRRSGLLEEEGRRAGPDAGSGEHDKSNEDMGDEDEDVKTLSVAESNVKKTESHKWKTQVIFVQLLRKLFDLCTTDPAHFNSQLTSRGKSESGEYLVMYLGDLVQVVCLASTGSMHELRLSGLTALQDLIRLFSATEDPNLPGSPFLIQFQAQIGAAFRPAFQTDMPPNISALACQVCGEWIVSGVSTGGQELQKVFGLLESTLSKIGQGSTSKHLYGDIMITLETLSVLGAWAEVYYKGQFSQTASENDRVLSSSLRPLVEPHLPQLSTSWFYALYDYSLLSLPSSQLTMTRPQQCHFFTLDSAENARSIYRHHWTKILKACSLWLSQSAQEESEQYIGQPLFDKLTLILGCISQTLFFPLSIERDEILFSCLFALETVLKSSWILRVFTNKTQIPSELLSILHRLVMAKQDLNTLTYVTNISLVLSRSLAPTRISSIQQEDFVPFDDTVYELLRITVLTLGVLVHEVLPTKRQISFKVNVSVAVQRDILSCIFRAVSHIPLILSPHLVKQVVTPVQLLMINFLNQQEFSELHPVVLEELKRLLINCHTLVFIQGDMMCAGFMELLKICKQRTSRSILLALSLYILSRPDYLVEYGGLVSECSSIFSQVLHGRDPAVILAMIEIIKKLYSLSDQNLANVFICKTAPSLFELLATPKYQDVLDSVISELVSCFEVLIALAPPKTNTELIKNITHVLVNKLAGSEQDSTSQESSKTHQVCLQALQQIGPKYPAQFKEVMNADVTMRQRLEQAILSSRKRSESEKARKYPEGRTKSTIGKPLSINFAAFQQT